MEQLRKGLQFVFSHKKKYLVLFLAVIVFIAVLFPYQDVGDVVSSLVAKQTGNQVYVTFDQLHPSILPVKIGLDELTVETPLIPAISVQHLEVTPSLTSLIMQKPEGTLIAKGLFRGDVQIQIKPGKKNDSGNPTHAVVLNAEKLSLSELHRIVHLPVLLKGQLSLKTSGTADPSFQDQPDFDIDLHVEKFELPTSNIETQMGPVSIPNIKLSQVEIKGRLSAGRFTIEKAVAGKTGDELNAIIKGGLNFQIQNRGEQLQPIFGAYQLDLDLTVQKNLFDKIGAFLGPLDAYKTPGTTEGSFRYQFKLSATGFEFTPSISALR